MVVIGFGTSLLLALAAAFYSPLDWPREFAPGLMLFIATASYASIWRSLGKPQVASGENEKSTEGDVLVFLSQLQQKGRFLDFVMDDISRYPDAQVGAVARVIHQGCADVVKDIFTVSPVHDGPEGGQLVLDADFDTSKYRLVGQVSGEGPFQGHLLHHGWLTTDVRLPRRVSANDGIIAPAEVQIS